METILVPIADLVIEPSLQVRSKHLDPSKVREYRNALKPRYHEEGDESPFPPVLVASLGDRLHLLDGFHRHKAHELEGWPFIKANCVNASSIAQALWLAAEPNMKHGLSLTTKERKETFKRFIDARAHCEADPDVSRHVKSARPKPHIMTLKEIAEKMGVSKGTIINWFQDHNRKQYNRLYAVEYDEERKLWDPDKPSEELFIEPSVGDTAAMSARNLSELIPKLTTPEEKKAALRGLAEAFVRVEEELGSTAVRSILRESDWLEELQDSLNSKRQAFDCGDF